MPQVIVGVCLHWFHIVDFHKFQSVFLRKPKPGTRKSFQKRKRQSEPSTSEEGSVLGRPPTLTPLVLRLASGIRYCYRSMSPRLSENTFSYKRHFCPDTSDRVGSVTVDCEGITHIQHNGKLFQLVQITEGLLQTYEPLFFLPRNPVLHAKDFSCIVLQ